MVFNEKPDSAQKSGYHLRQLFIKQAARHNDVLAAFSNFADFVNRFIDGSEDFLCLFCFLAGENQEHAKTAVVCTVHFMWIDASQIHQEREYRKHRPEIGIQYSAGALWKDSRDVVVEAAASDMDETFDVSALQYRQDRSRIEAGRCEEDFAKRLIEAFIRFLQGQVVVLDDAAYEGVSIEWTPVDGSPRMTSPGAIVSPVMRSFLSTMPTAKPATS